MSDPPTAMVYLVGAGPGDPGLLTLRGAECLAQADLVLYDKLVPPRMLDFAPPHAERLSVEGLPGGHPDRWPNILRTLIGEARKTRRVVRLKGGDPLIFGRGGEEAEALAKAGVPYEIVPGISAGVGAAAYAEIPLTHRSLASAVAFVTGHENPMKPGGRLDWPALARFPGTLVVYMGMAKLTLIQKRLMDEGKPPDTPAAVVQGATTGGQRTVVTTLADLDRTATHEGLTAPSVLLIGPAVSLRPERSWFERKPLHDCRVLVARPRHQAGPLVRQLELLGAMPFALPAVEIADPDDWGPVDRSIARIREYDWLVFTSPNGVRSFLRRLREIGRDLRALGGVRVAVIGPGTASALREYHIDPDLSPAGPDYNSESLAAALLPAAAGKRVLLARADRGRDVLRERLAGVASVEQVTAYRQIDAIDAHSDVLERIRRGEINYALLTSSNIARGLLDALDDTGRERVRSGVLELVSISPVTTAAVRERGFGVVAEATEYTPEGTVAALVEFVRHK
jgi:uroporphyrinogen III methyltransferase/synthase